MIDVIIRDKYLEVCMYSGDKCSKDIYPITVKKHTISSYTLMSDGIPGDRFIKLKRIAPSISDKYLEVLDD